MSNELNKSPPAHTALPWLYDAQTFEIYIADDEHEPCDVIADMEVLKTPRHHAHANGEFIVRACNSHYELIEILEAIIVHDDAHWLKDTDRQCEEDICVQSDELEAVLDRARAAIAKARGQ
jgi:hypothetical protein